MLRDVITKMWQRNGWAGVQRCLRREGFILPPGEYLATRFRDGDGVLPLGRQSAVAGCDGPSVSCVELRVSFARVDHGLYCEGHARLEA